MSRRLLMAAQVFVPYHCHVEKYPPWKHRISLPQEQKATSRNRISSSSDRGEHSAKWVCWSHPKQIHWSGGLELVLVLSYHFIFIHVHFNCFRILCTFFYFQFFISALSFATFAVSPELPQNRLQLSFTLLLTSVAFKFVINQSLPKISYLTYMVS